MGRESPVPGIRGITRSRHGIRLVRPDADSPQGYFAQPVGCSARLMVIYDRGCGCAGAGRSCGGRGVTAGGGAGGAGCGCGWGGKLRVSQLITGCLPGGGQLQFSIKLAFQMYFSLYPVHKLESFPPLISLSLTNTSRSRPWDGYFTSIVYFTLK